MDPKDPKNAFDGVKAVVEMLQQMAAPDRAKLLSGIAERDPGMAKRIEGRLFTFEKFTELDSASLRTLINEAPRDILALSLRNASEALKKSIFSSLPQRAGEMLRQEVDQLGPRKLSEVQSAQAQLVNLALSLEAQGKITRSRV